VSRADIGFCTLHNNHQLPQVLRDNKATLMTCAETFLHDPLVDWARGSKGGSSAAAAGPEAENPQVRACWIYQMQQHASQASVSPQIW
jgi:phosphatidylinositol kinase/protein kinase (PI-3  family)